MQLDYDIRLIRATETAVLRRMLYLAIFVPPGGTAPDESILDEPRLAAIYENWGRPGDLSLVATEHHDHGGSDHGEAAANEATPAEALHSDAAAGEHHHSPIIGAAWYRLFPADAPGYGFVAPGIPELAVAVVPEFRGMGVGTALLRALISRASEVGYRGISLSVDSRNPALGLYERLGFQVVKDGESPTMLLEFEGG
jgi:ribosomal protein S18 acetylase RimI-like enzyme